MLNKFPFFSQVEQMDCGPVCLKIILKYYGKNCDLSYLRNCTEVTRTGVTLADLHNAAEKLNFHSTPFQININELQNDVHLPCILHWEQQHFVVLYKIKNGLFYISDPKFGKLKLNKEEFQKLWVSSEKSEGIGLQIIPTEAFIDIALPYNKYDLETLKGYTRSILENQSGKMKILFLLTLISTVISYIFPQLIQNMFDKSYSTKDFGVLWKIFGFQLLLYVGQIIVNLLQSFVGIHFSSQVSIKMLTDLLYKTVKLPISFFENRLYTDILQKIEEQSKIEQLFTRQLISSILSLFLVIALIIRLITYNIYLGISFIFLSLFSVIWLYLFYNRRKILDYYAFKLNSDNKNQLVEIITGMVSVKISNAHYSKIENWNELQKKIYVNKIKSLVLETYQTYVTTVVKQLFVFSCTFVCTYWVVQGKITIGEMLSIGYIIGIASSPIESLVVFFRTLQESDLVYKRVQEILQQKDENEGLKIGSPKLLESDINAENLWFKYPGGNQDYVLKNINLQIPNSKVTAIVGESGSGKTTLSKLLLSFYPTSQGVLKIGNNDLFNIDHDWWRGYCGVVLQDSYIFSGSIAENISMESEGFDEKKLEKACRIANIHNFIAELPLGFNTKIGNSGSDLSGGQKQRILIARAIYKDPSFIFFDEATSALDAENERVIHDNLHEFFKGRTVIIIAHRLSTVRKADNIVVLKRGEIVEQGSHEELVNKRGEYYKLIKNQLELGE